MTIKWKTRLWVTISANNGVDYLEDKWFHNVDIPVDESLLTLPQNEWSIVTEHGETFDPINQANLQSSDDQ